MSIIKVLESLKREGNEEFVTGCRLISSFDGQDHLKKACTIYGNAISAIIEYEGEEQWSLTEDELPLYEMLKATMFLNLAAANLRLDSPEGAKKCCNATIMFCNNPSLQLEDLGDTDEDIALLEPVAPQWASTAMKALFRRGKCLQDLGKTRKALDDFLVAQRLAPADKTILVTIAEVSAMLGIPVEPSTPPPPPPPVSDEDGKKNKAQTKSTDTTDDATSTDNGGSCWLRRGTWSQDIEDVVVNFPVISLLGNLQGVPIPRESDAGTGSELVQKTVRKYGWSIEFSRQSIAISYADPPATIATSATVTTAAAAAPETGFTNNIRVLELELQHPVIADECTWTLTTATVVDTSAAPTLSLESNATVTPVSDVPQPSTASTSVQPVFSAIVLYLAKDMRALKGRGGGEAETEAGAGDTKWSPGCEWWDRVFAGDEAIDTTTCSIGSDTSQLPKEARIRAQREHERFASLTEAEREAELGNLVAAKKAFVDAEARTRAAASQEDRAVGEVPERAEMLEALRSEFPNVEFTAK